MWDQIKQHYLQPETDDEAQRRAALLVMVLRLFMGGAVIMAALPLIISSTNLARDYVIVGSVALGSLLLSHLTFRHYVRGASLLGSLLLFSGVTGALWTSEGFQSGVAYGYFLVVIVAALLLNKSAALIFGGLCFLSNTGFFLYQQWNDILLPQRLAITQVHWIFLNIILAVATFLLSTAAGNITHALQKNREIAQVLRESDTALRAYADRLKIQHEIDQAILSAQSPQAIAQAALARLQPLIPNLHSSVMVFDVKHQQMTGLVAYARGERAPELETRFDGLEIFNIAGLSAGQTQSVLDMSQAPTLSPIHQYFYDNGMRSYINVPLLTQNELIGTLNVGSETPHFFTATHLEIALEIAASLAVAIHQARLYEQVQHDAMVKSRLLEEINHRVGNNLNAIIGLLHVERHFTPEGTELQRLRHTLEHLEQRIAALGEVHKMLSENSWAPLNLQDLIARLIRQVLNNLPNGHAFKMSVSPTERVVSSRQANQLAFVIAELAANSVAFAWREDAVNHITVHIAEVDNQVEIIYRDDGPGYPDTVLREERFNVGLYLIQRIVTATLHGRVTLLNDNGAVAIIRFEREEPSDVQGKFYRNEAEFCKDL
ncbi:MAG TPA: histidine kinase dimerization/phosphoacceptor domain -containing protein [Anaerolineae bacterium]|nr:histidine kinase dimerization/phosphoacceptor domain -containing protein [Anaerolineae bacterium]